MNTLWKKLRRSPQLPVGPLIIALIALFLAPQAMAVEAAKPGKPEPQETPAPAPSPGIPVAEVATRAMAVSNLLRTFSTNLAPSPEIEEIRNELPGVIRSIDQQARATQRILEEQPSLETLQGQQQIWQSRERQIARWLNILTARATQLQEALGQLAALHKTWTLARQSAESSKAPTPIIQQIDATVVALAVAREPLNTQRTAVLDLQSKVANEADRCGNALGVIAQAQRTAVGGIFARERPPIWSTHLWGHLKTTLPTRIPEVAASLRTALREYFRDPSRGFPFDVAVFVGLALLFCAARRQVDQWAASGRGISSGIMVFERPYAAALTGALLFASGPFMPTPHMVRNLFAVLALFPMIRLIRPVVPPPMIPLLLTLGTLFALDTVRQAFAGAPLIGETILVLEALAGIAVLGWFLRRESRRRIPAAEGAPARIRALEAGVLLLLVLLAAGLTAAALGYLRLARFISPGILAGGVQALTVFAIYQVAKGAVAFALRVWPLRLLQMVGHHRSSIEKRFYRWLVWLAVLIWVIRYLNYVGLLEPVLSSGEGILATKLQRGSINTSVEDILAFFLALWVSYLLSAFLRFMLQEDVYPRIGVPKGVSYAASSLLHYVLITLGFIVGIGMLGVDLTKVTVLAGALGVGIGFGLQGVVNNFVSGLILLFERPVHVGDTVEIGDMMCEIRRIGIRASRVRTWRGADIIVPNSQLTSEKLTNWTLGDRLRRIDLPVGINYSSPPQEVIKVLTAVALAHPQVLKEPAPQVQFVGYGDSSLNFELWAWTDQFRDWPRIRSDLAVALYDAVHQAGMSFPFPQREVRLLSDSAAGSKAAPKGAANQSKGTPADGTGESGKI
jgi:potassium efflux system protein